MFALLKTRVVVVVVIPYAVCVNGARYRSPEGSL